MTKTDTPLTLADIAEPRPSDGTAGFRVWRGLRKVWNWLLPRTMVRTVIIGGIRYLTDNNDSLGRELIQKGHWEREQIVFFFNEARRRGARVFLDVGANFGYYSLLAARLGIFDEIHAFEPHPETYKRLLWHIRANNFEGAITPHNIAASDAVRDMSMSKNSDPGNALLHKSNGGTVNVSAAPLDSLFSFRGQNICAKIDTEGHEDEVLQGAADLLMHNDVFLQIEILGLNSAYIGEMLARGFSLINRCQGDFYFVRDKQNGGG